MPEFLSAKMHLVRASVDLVSGTTRSTASDIRGGVATDGDGVGPDVPEECQPAGAAEERRVDGVVGAAFERLDVSGQIEGMFAESGGSLAVHGVPGLVCAAEWAADC